MQQIKKDDKTRPAVINGIDTDGVKSLIGHVAEDSANAITHWHVTSSWKGGTRSDNRFNVANAIKLNSRLVVE